MPCPQNGAGVLKGLIHSWAYTVCVNVEVRAGGRHGMSFDNRTRRTDRSSTDQIDHLQYSTRYIPTCSSVEYAVQDLRSTDQTHQNYASHVPGTYLKVDHAGCAAPIRQK